MSIHTSREQRRQLARDNAKMPKHLELVPPADWPQAVLSAEKPPVAVWRSRTFLVQKYLAAAPAIARLSVLRTTLAGDRWQDGQHKSEAGHYSAWVRVEWANDQQPALALAGNP